METSIGMLKRVKLKLGLLVAISIIFLGCARESIYKSTWQSTPVTIDGKSSEWTTPLRFFDSKTKLSYSVSNDAQNLYIFIRSDDDATVSGITSRGLQIWIDTTGKKNHQAGILCPIPKRNAYALEDSNNRKRRGHSGNNERQSNEGIKDTAVLNRLHRSFLKSTRQMHVSGFKNIPDGLLDNPNNYGINIGVNWDDSNVLIYEAAIPIKSFFRYPLLSSDTSRTIGVSFNFTATIRTENYEGFGPAGGDMGFGLGGVGFIFSPGGQGSSSNPKPEVIWTPFHLSVR